MVGSTDLDGVMAKVEKDRAVVIEEIKNCMEIEIARRLTLLLPGVTFNE
jgi:hypothetical protein